MTFILNLLASMGEIGRSGRVTAHSSVIVSATVRSSCLEAFQERQRFLELGKLLLFGFEFAGVDAAADAFHFHRVLEVQHLVIEQVFDCVAGA
jgi:hypothetical protein